MGLQITKLNLNHAEETPILSDRNSYHIGGEDNNKLILGFLDLKVSTFSAGL
jgi:hypothetical protein